MRPARVASLSLCLTLFCLLLGSIRFSNAGSLDQTEKDNGSGDDKDEKINFERDEVLSPAEHTSDDSPAEDEEDPDEPLVGTSAPPKDKDDDDEEEEEETEKAGKELTATAAKENDAEEDTGKLSATNNDKNDDEPDSNESNKDTDEGSGEVVEQNIEPRTGSEPGNPDEKPENGEDDVTTKKQSKRSKWQYYGAYGPGNWSTEFSGCSNGDERFQSPINIVTEQTQFVDIHRKITYDMKHTDKPCNSLLINDAKTAKVIFESSTVRVNGLDKVYEVASVQFRWGDTNDAGSEHAFAGKRYPLEMQVLCYDAEKFPDFIEAEWVADNTSSTIVIIATLFEISNNDNPLLSSVVQNLKSIQSPGENISIPSLDLASLLPTKNDFFYSYSGSLTSPPCHGGGAEWIVFHDRQIISASQLAQFRLLHEEDFEDGNYTTIDYNWRPIQPLDGRVVSRSFPLPKKESPKTPKPSAIKTPNTSSHLIPAIDISVCTLFFVWKLFLG